MLKSRLAALAAGAAVIVLSAAPSVASIADTPTISPVVHVASSSVSARHLLDLLAVKPEAHASSYARSKFRLWVDANRDGENTRAEVLKAESTKRVTENSHHTVVTGRWVSPYDGVVVTTASKLDIDHLVPLEEAWTSGASAWTTTRRTAYANDTAFSGSLIAVTAHANRSKGDREPGQWLPSRAADDCKYVKQYIAVKYRWALAVNPGEKAALAAELTSYCGTNLSLTAVRRVTATQVRGLAGVRAAAATAGSTGGSSATDPDYGTCANAKAHGASTPYREGVDPEYAYYRDADHDGLVCE
ncbi:MAG: hypothetical protein QOE37_1823 [Microbacteriaceae bacterium]|jgi:hypothetical protein|nr:hypothetical protein [Microbacteriaceae bacterium]